MADVKSKIEKLANELKEQQQQCRQNSTQNTRPILPHLNTDSITTVKKTGSRPTLSPFSRAKSHQLQQQNHHHFVHQPSTPAIPGLEPTSRSLADLHNERSYLLHNLQTQGERATRLYQRYAHLEAKKEALKAASSASPPSASAVESPSQPPPATAAGSGSGSTTATSTSTSTSSKKKNIKKDLSLLRSRIAESTQQEQLIMLRLGEIHVELVNRGRWVMTHQQQQQQQQQQQMVYSPMSAVVMEGQGYFGHHHQWQHRGHGRYEIPPATPSSAGDGLYSNSPVGSGGEYLYTPSILSPLSPSFVPGGGVNFSEDIWTRPSESQQQQPQEHYPAPETGPYEYVPEQQVEDQQEQEQQHHVVEEDEQTPKPKTYPQELNSPALPLSAVTPKFTTTTSTVSTTSTSLPSEHLATPITPSTRIPWDEYPSDSEDDGSFDSFDASSFTPICVTATTNPLAAAGTTSGSSGSGSGVMVSEPEEEQQPRQQQEGQEEQYEGGELEEEEEEEAGSDDSASEPGDLLSERTKTTTSFSNRRLSMPSLKNLWPAALAAVGVSQGFKEEGEEVPEMRLDTVI